MPEKRYLGDEVYAEFDGYQIILSTERAAASFIDEIALDPDVFQSLLNYVEYVKDFYAKLG